MSDHDEASGAALIALHEAIPVANSYSREEFGEAEAWGWNACRDYLLTLAQADTTDPLATPAIPTHVICEQWSLPPEQVRCTHREQKPGELATYTIPCNEREIAQVIPCACGSGDLCVQFHPPSFRCARHVVVDIAVDEQAVRRTIERGDEA